jgi:hypothetical protein
MAGRSTKATAPATEDPTEVTPGAEAEADRPLSLARDALIADQYDENVDYVPELDTKGYHAGLVRQPAEVVGSFPDNVRGFRATGIAGESKFKQTSFRELKAANSAMQADDPAYAGVVTTNEDAFDPEKLAAAERKAAKAGPAPDGGRAPAGGEGDTGKTGADSFRDAEKAAKG